MFSFIKKLFKQNQTKEDKKSKFTTTSELLNVLPQNISDIKVMHDSIINISSEKLISWLACQDKNKSMLIKFDEILTILNCADGSFGSMSYVLQDPEITEYASSMKLSIADFFNKKVFCKQVFRKFEEISNFIEKDELKEDEIFFINKMRTVFINSGCNLDAQAYNYLKELAQQEEHLVSTFSKNIALFAKKLTFKKDDLLGCSEAFLQTWKTEEKNIFSVGVDYPSYFEIMHNCKISETRRQIYVLFMNRAYPENEVVLEKIISLRREVASILSYPDYATLNISNKMAKTPEKVLSFLNEIKDSISKKAEKQLHEIMECKPEEIQLTKDGLLEPWDYGFLQKLYQEKYFNINENYISEFFPLEQTLKNIFEIYQNLLNLKFEFVEDLRHQLWHPDVLLLKVTDTKTSLLVGHLILDLHPRENKYTHACCYAIVSGVENEIISQKPFALVISNFPKSTKESPALLKYEDVKTFFHELGHGMHCMLGQTKLGSFSGYNVLDDFAETPSQLFEEWMKDPKVLQELSHNYKTGKQLPLETINQLLKKEEFLLAIGTQRQVKLSLFSLYLHSSYPPYNSFKDLEEIINQEIVSKISTKKETHFYASFGHLVAGNYAASYYLYLWSLVYAKDLWSEISSLGINSQASAQLIKELLSAGGSIDPMHLMRSVMKREPSRKSFIEYLSK